ncbi:hypothetical protein BAA08_01280 [Bizionia sp. APA-3]|nr:hypothetical protein BAA08_01280 [Bizionia sp. APA-3]
MFLARQLDTTLNIAKAEKLMSRHNQNPNKMKKQVLLFTALLIGLTTVTANENRSVSTADDLTILNNSYAQPIIFMERGIEFMIFPNGSFDFNTNASPQASHFESNYYYRSSTQTRRGSVNVTFGAPAATKGVRYAAPRNRGVIITHDANGQVRRIGNVFINYDRNGKIKRAGSIYMNYNRNGLLKQVGGLHINYNSWGEIISQYGFVSPFSNMCHVCGIYSCTTSHGSINTHSDYNNNDYNSEDFYYYKKGKSDDPKIKAQPIKRKR